MGGALVALGADLWTVGDGLSGVDTRHIFQFWLNRYVQSRSRSPSARLRCRPMDGPKQNLLGGFSIYPVDAFPAHGRAIDDALRHIGTRCALASSVHMGGAHADFDDLGKRGNADLLDVLGKVHAKS